MLIQDSAVVACASKSAGDTRMARMWAKELNKSAKTILATNYCVLWAGPRVKALDRRGGGRTEPVQATVKITRSGLGM